MSRMRDFHIKLAHRKRESAMIVIEQQPKRVEVTVYAEFTLADYKEFENAVNFAIQFEGPVDLWFDLREMADFTHRRGLGRYRLCARARQRFQPYCRPDA
jgi:hypothetical protein